MSDLSEGRKRMPTRGKFLNIGKAHVKRNCKARSKTVAVERGGLGGRMEGKSQIFGPEIG